jgi:hypothetical protein
MRRQLILAQMNERFIEHDYDYEHAHIEHSIETPLSRHTRRREGWMFLLEWIGCWVSSGRYEMQRIRFQRCGLRPCMYINAGTNAMVIDRKPNKQFAP